MRAKTLLNRIIGLPGLWVKGMRHEDEVLVIEVARRFRKLTCPACGTQVRSRFHETVRRWRHWGFVGLEVYLEGPIRRLRCPRCDTVRTEAVPWARPGSAFTRPFEDAVAMLAQKLNRTAVAELTGIAWATVGSIAERLVREQLGPDRFQGLKRIGIDEISYRKYHRYLTIVVDHDRECVIWAGEGKSAETLLAFFDEIGPAASAALEIVSMDMSSAYQKAVRQAAPQATIVFDRFHVAQLANAATDQVRRDEVNQLPPAQRSTLKQTRWAVLKRPDHLRATERDKLSSIQRHNRRLYRAYLLKESFLDIFTLDSTDEARPRLAEWLAWAARSKLEPFVKLGRTVRTYHDALLRFFESRLTNARLEGMNNNIRLLSHRSYGLHSADALISLVYLCYAGIQLPQLQLI